jgi:hypothetical protein
MPPLFQIGHEGLRITGRVICGLRGLTGYQCNSCPSVRANSLPGGAVIADNGKRPAEYAGI